MSRAADLPGYDAFGDEELQRKQSRGAAVSAVSVVLALLLVVAGAYTAAQESRSIADAATEIQRIDVVRLRVAEFEAAQLLRQSGDAAFTNTAGELEARAIDELTVTLASGELPEDLAIALEAYVDAANQDESTPATGDMIVAIDTARDEVAGRLDDSSSLLDSLSVLLVITITYIVPALAFVVFWLAIRQTRRLQEAHAEIRHLRRRSVLRDALVDTRLNAIEAAASNTTASRVSASVVAGVAETRSMIESIDERSVAVLGEVELHQLLQAVEKEHRSISGKELELSPGLSALAEATVRADARLTARGLSLIAANARRRGCTQLRVSHQERHGALSLVFSHDGAPLTEAEARLVVDQVPLAGDGALERGSELLLLAYAGRLLEQSRATLEIERADGLEQVVVTLPTAPRLLGQATPETLPDTEAA